MTKKQMAETILQRSSCIGVSETRFYKNVLKSSKSWIQHYYELVMFSSSEESKRKNANFAMFFLK